MEQHTDLQEIGNGNVRAPPLKCGAIDVRPHTQAGAHPAQDRVQG